MFCPYLFLISPSFGAAVGLCFTIPVYLHRGLDKEEYLMIILGYFFLFLHKNICCRYSLEVPHQGASNENPQHVFMVI